MAGKIPLPFLERPLASALARDRLAECLMELGAFPKYVGLLMQEVAS
jgi:hypothetical protein